MAGYHVSSLKPNEVSPNLRLGTFALKWPEETNKLVVIEALLRHSFVRSTYSLQRRLPLPLIYRSIPKVSICFAWTRWRKYARRNLDSESIRPVCFLCEGNWMLRHRSDSWYANGFRSTAPSSNVHTRTSAWRMCCHWVFFRAQSTAIKLTLVSSMSRCLRNGSLSTTAVHLYLIGIYAPFTSASIRRSLPE